MAEQLTLAEISAEVLNTNFTQIEDAVNAKAELNGDSTERFNAADAVELTEAINKRQLNNTVAAINADIATKADKSYVDTNLALKANTADVEAALATKANLNGNTSQVFNVADATTPTEAVNKGQLDSVVESIETEIENFKPSIGFCMTSGNVNAIGDAEILSYSGTTLSFKVGGSYPSLNLVYADNTKETLVSIADITGISTNGLFTIIKEKGQNPIFTNAVVTQGKIFPSSPINGAYHSLIATGIQTYKYVNGHWIETQYVPLGTVAVGSGVITAVTTKHYNENGYDRPYKYDSGWFAVSAVQSYTLSHNLGTTNLKYQYLLADDINGTNQRPASSYFFEGTPYNSHIGYTPCQTTLMTFSFAINGAYVGHSVSSFPVVAGYYRVLAETI